MSDARVRVCVCVCLRTAVAEAPVCMGAGGACSGFYSVELGSKGVSVSLRRAGRLCLYGSTHSRVWMLACGGFTGLGVCELMLGMCRVGADLGIVGLWGWLTRAVCEWGVRCHQGSDLLREGTSYLEVI